MRWFSVARVNGSGLDVVGVILTSDGGQIVAAALDGDYDNAGSAFRVIADLVDEGAMTVLRNVDGHLRRVREHPGQPGYVEALLANLRPPLVSGPRGSFSRADTPPVLIDKVWSRVAPEGVDRPRLVDMNGLLRARNRR